VTVPPGSNRTIKRHRARRHRVAAAQLGSVDLHFARSVVDQPLGDVGRLGPSRSTIWAGVVTEPPEDFVIRRRQRHNGLPGETLLLIDIINAEGRDHHPDGLGDDARSPPRPSVDPL
jgi:hypothetical protein